MTNQIEQPTPRTLFSPSSKRVRRTGLGIWMFVASLLATSLARADTKADVLAVMNKEEDGFNSYDAKMIASLFSTDADWWNPFGVHLAGRAEIESFMTRLFSRPGYRSGKNTSQIVFEVRIATDNVAVVHGYEESAGQVDDDTGKKMDPRKSHYLDVLVKREGGWLIVSEMIMDEK